ncbi:GH25 family lysozyme [Lachnospiraceae bacterium YH-ros2226]|jgi:GH25 family lysozyme M1 (1,4-beta-N-acetylmuramidase)|nr:LysM peptidoglycan-binding domain-containing protein [Lachnospiraceae bacterium]MCH4032062.1 LysM peptidoglycan-binding domain-containing protein [Lachnospiraceae bacterium]MCH4109061.1 LysM peptidoglycan-binding domain-containing protein [Lachnospiraceae bacterium]MCI1302188.1 LysM peptidoglycan-binding domain-containing protein [Lachnospiraceae bacterium]
MSEYRGIDISHWQGAIDWAKVKAAGIQFAIIKSGGSDAGFYTDPRWEENYKGAKANGIAVGAYYFVGPGCISVADGQADAERFLAQLKGKQFEYPVYIDVEATPASKKAGATEAVIAFCRAMEAGGYYAGIYSSTYSGFRDRLDDSKLTPFTHWVAQYASKCTYGGSYGIWQYSSSGQVNGISGRVDMDVSYQDFPSIIKAGGFNGYAKKAAAPKPVAPVQPHKTVEKIAREVLTGKWGNGDDRRRRLASAGYDAAAVQAKVNELLHAQSRPQAVYYTIQRGDTLSGIARRYGTSVSAIQKLNASLIRNVNRIQAGWKIRVK